MALAIVAMIVALTISGAATAAVFNCSAGDVACLISAIDAANLNPNPDTINLAAGTYTLTAVNNMTFFQPNGLPVISTDIRIQGAGTSATIVQRSPGGSTPQFRIVQVASTGTLALMSLTIQNGHINGGFFATGSSGGIGLLNFGIATLNEVAIVNNVEEAGSGGAGISNAGTLTMVKSRIEGNSTDDAQGGGIFSTGIMSLGLITIRGNTAKLFGGGIASYGLASITFSSIVDNQTSAGGGGILIGGVTGIASSTIARNTAAVPSGSGVHAGGGIEISGGSVNINNSTIADNTVDSGDCFPPPCAAGGGISQLGGTVQLQNTILARNSTFEGGVPGQGQDCFGSVTSLGHNLVGDLGLCTITLLGSDRTGPPGLGTFIDNGMAGNGHIPLLGTSQAVDQGDPASCTSTDQLLFRRVDGNRDGVIICDIGAIEFSNRGNVSDLLDLAPLVTAFDASPVPGGPAGVFTIRATFTNRTSVPIHDAVFVVAELSGGNLLLNADGGAGGVGATLTPDVGADAVLSPGESFTAEFAVGLQTRRRYTFFVDILGVPGP